MKKIYKDFFIIIICLLFFYFSLTNNKLINFTIIDALKLYLKKVFPSLFPMILINNILIDYNFPYYFIKLLGNKGLKIYVIILSLLSGSPNNAIIIKELYNNNYISLEDANNMLTYTFFSSPLFLISMLSPLFSIKTIIRIIIITYSSNIIISLFFKLNKTNIIIFKNNKQNISNDIYKTIKTLIIILGTIIFFLLLSTFIINILNLNNINSLFVKGLLEITQGLNELYKININYKIIISLIFINFGGLSIHMQIKSILSDTNLSYKYFLFGRLLCLILSIIINCIH